MRGTGKDDLQVMGLTVKEDGSFITSERECRKDLRGLAQCFDCVKMKGRKPSQPEIENGMD